MAEQTQGPNSQETKQCAQQKNAAANNYREIQNKKFPRFLHDASFPVKIASIFF
jgi:hypothetical protein